MTLPNSVIALIVKLFFQQIQMAELSFKAAILSACTFASLAKRGPEAVNNYRGFLGGSIREYT